MATLEAGSRLDNIVRSVNVYVQAEIAVALGYPVFYEGQDTSGPFPSRWVIVDFIPGSAVGEVMSAPNHNISIWSEAFLNINCFEQLRPGLGTANLYSLMTMAESIRNKFLPTTAIPIRDYGAVGNPQVGALMIWERASITEVPVSPDIGIKQLNVSVPMRYHEVIQLS